MEWHLMTDGKVEEEIGKRIKERRLKLNLTQLELSEKTELGRATISRLELGQVSTVSNFIKVLRVLNLLQNLEHLLPVEPISPIAMRKLKMKKRKRASSKKSNKLK